MQLGPCGPNVVHMAHSTSHNIVVDVQSVFAESGKSLPSLSEETGISQGRLSRLIQHPGQSTIDEFAALTRALPINLTDAEVA